MLVSKSVRSKVLKVAHQLKSKGLSFSEAQKIAWCKMKANHAKTVTFITSKKEVTTRRIAPLSSIGYTPKISGKPRSISQISTIKVVDLDKLESGLDKYRCIISFHLSQMIELVA